MPLRASEAVQCQCCEEYSRLNELLDVKMKGGIVQAVKITDEEDPRYDDGHESPYIGQCPHCGENLFMRNIG